MAMAGNVNLEAVMKTLESMGPAASAPVASQAGSKTILGGRRRKSQRRRSHKRRRTGRRRN